MRPHKRSAWDRGAQRDIAQHKEYINRFCRMGISLGGRTHARFNWVERVPATRLELGLSSEARIFALMSLKLVYAIFMLMSMLVIHSGCCCRIRSSSRWRSE
eukprot:565422-Prymnesium_polylepis.1